MPQNNHSGILRTWLCSCTPHLTARPFSVASPPALKSNGSRPADCIVPAFRTCHACMQTPAACSKMVDLAAASGKALHLGEGQVQEDRDNAFAALKAGKWARAG
jgi:hypothetical protein